MDDSKIANDQKFMKMALAEAKRAYKKDEVPIGALLVYKNKIIGRGHNLKEFLQSPLGHAEVIAIHRASKLKQNWRLEDCTLYVTLEPCLMCAGTIWQSRIARVVFAAYDPKAGALKTLYNVGEDKRLNHQFECLGGVFEDESKKLLQKFFKKLRVKYKAK